VFVLTRMPGRAYPRCQARTAGKLPAHRRYARHPSCDYKSITPHRRLSLRYLRRAMPVCRGVRTIGRIRVIRRLRSGDIVAAVRQKKKRAIERTARVSRPGLGARNFRDSALYDPDSHRPGFSPEKPSHECDPETALTHQPANRGRTAQRSQCPVAASATTSAAVLARLRREPGIRPHHACAPAVRMPSAAVLGGRDARCTRALRAPSKPSAKPAQSREPIEPRRRWKSRAPPFVPPALSSCRPPPAEFVTRATGCRNADISEPMPPTKSPHVPIHRNSEDMEFFAIRGFPIRSVEPATMSEAPPAARRHSMPALYSNESRLRPNRATRCRCTQDRRRHNASRRFERLAASRLSRSADPDFRTFEHPPRVLRQPRATFRRNGSQIHPTRTRD